MHPEAPAATVAERLRLEVGGVLADFGVPAESVAAELTAMETVRIGATASRAVLGCMNDAVKQLEGYPRGAHGELPLRDASLYLAENIYSRTDFERPWLRVLRLFGVGTTGPVTVRTLMWH